MKQYIGVKIINASPMNRAEYNKIRGWEIPANENPIDEGYLVEYTDGGKSNVDGYTGYVSWSPKDVFERAYRSADGLSFGLAIEAAKKGEKVSRAGWNGKEMFVVYMPALYLPPFNSQTPGAKVNDRTAKYIGEDVPLDSQPYFAMKTANNKWQPGWLPSQSDILADDWYVVTRREASF